ncbi:hypothetical protein ACFWYW_56160 [Nonomuraea sp. NPDC059023]|uniref:hypothetical protein n=1 Tax=unclassified Nonomuraea TaxID=2593643 RepID=UPI00369DAA67
MSDEIAEPHSLPLLHRTAQQVALEYRKRHRGFMLAPLIGAAIAGIKATLEWGWLGTVGMLGLAVITLSVIVATRKISAVRLRARFRDPSAFAVAFWPLDPGYYRRFGAKQWRQRSYRALLVISRVQLAFLPDEKGRRKGRNDFSLPLTGIRNIVVSPGVLRPGTMAFVGLDSGRVLHFHVLDRGVPFIAALRAVGVVVLEEHQSESHG